jgi:hypothetical protein
MKKVFEHVNYCKGTPEGFIHMWKKRGLNIVALVL